MLTLCDNSQTSTCADLVFIQNGMLQPWLDDRGLGDNTQALVFFAVAKLGDPPTDGITDANPEGLTAVTGKHAEAFAARVKAGGLSCHVLPADEYRAAMLEKLVWIWCALDLMRSGSGGLWIWCRSALSIWCVRFR